jgi:hypothetical protein
MNGKRIKNTTDNIILNKFNINWHLLRHIDNKNKAISNWLLPKPIYQNEAESRIKLSKIVVYHSDPYSPWHPVYEYPKHGSKRNRVNHG